MNLPGILKVGGLKSDCMMVNQHHAPIGYTHIKQRRMTEIRVPCRNNRFVGEFVPFYYCPRSPMLYVVNQGTTGRPAGCQNSILHLVSTVAIGMAQDGDWTVSDGNAGSAYSSFYDDLEAGFAAIDWKAVRATDWRAVTNQKSAEFLVADFFPWSGIQIIGCHDSGVAEQVRGLLNKQAHQPAVQVQTGWYY